MSTSHLSTLEDLSTLEELAWATGMDPTGGKEITSNVFDRDRLKAREAGLTFGHSHSMSRHSIVL